MDKLNTMALELNMMENYSPVGEAITNVDTNNI